MTTLPAPAPTASAAGAHAGGAALVEAAGQAVNDAAADLFDTVRTLGRAGSGSVTEWMGVLADGAAAKARIEAVQTVALAHLAAIDVIDAGCDDGTWTEQHRGLGHIRFDAPELVAPTLGLTPSGAEVRIRQAVALTTRTPAVVHALASGRADAYRAGIVADELTDAPVADARAVVAALGDRFGAEAGGRLRARVRRELHRINPDLVRRQCLKARSNTGLRRWVNGDGTDTWQVDAPTETSRAAYAAVNDLAVRLKKDTGVNIAAARAAALFQLVLGHSTGSYQIHVGIPLSTLHDAALHTSPGRGPTGTGGMSTGDSPDTSSSGDSAHTSSSSDHARATTSSSDHARATSSSGDSARTTNSSSGDGAHRGDSALGYDEGDLVEVTGMDAPGPTYVPRGWLTDLLDGSADPSGAVRARADAVGCHDLSGGYATAPIDPARTRPAPTWRTEAYHPTPAIRAAVTARDGHCRFPGCHATARLCDLDHVTPWPTGPTTPTNLVLLCRRHHRIKQGPGWTVRLHPDGTLTWIDPLDRRLTTTPINHLSRPPDPTADDRRDGSTTGPLCALDDARDRFDPDADRLDELNAGSSGAARHTHTTLDDGTTEVHTVLLTHCPIQWELTGSSAGLLDTGGRGQQQPPATRTPSRSDPPPQPMNPHSGETTRAHPASWSDGTHAEGDEPPF